ncbi:MAG: hypothetical protein U9Q15_03465 [Patescibacteria group bacterium]|nr:hypothetical protein [Patescibacteria group bacterium]
MEEKKTDLKTQEEQTNAVVLNLSTSEGGLDSTYVAVGPILCKVVKDERKDKTKNIIIGTNVNIRPDTSDLIIENGITFIPVKLVDSYVSITVIALARDAFIAKSILSDEKIVVSENKA